jgi:hypothetical protein
MAMVPLATQGNVLHIYDFRVKPGKGDEFIRLFNEFDYSDANLMHKSKAQVKDGVLCRRPEDPDHFYLIGEWRSVEEHRAMLAKMMSLPRPGFFDLLIDKWAPTYVDVVSSTPQEYLDKAG